MIYSGSPIVTVVIPTRNRAQLMIRAVKSALGQTLSDIEVVTVVDGHDPESASALQTLGDPRVHPVYLDASVGGSQARNIGVQKARGQFIAFLDDDDEWLPNKLELQYEASRTSTRRRPVVTSRLIARRPDSDEVWPRRWMRDGESMGDYLFCRNKSIRQGEGFIQTSTLLVPRDLALEVPFRAGLPRHQDWDWLIRVSSHPEVVFICVWKALVIYHIDGHRKSISAGRDAGPSIEWISNNTLVTPKARAYFFATQVAVRCRSLKAFLKIVRETVFYPKALLIGLGFAVIPRYVVSRMRTKAATHA